LKRVFEYKDFCPQGHPYDEQNTYIYKGNRRCKRCNLDRFLRRQRAKDAQKRIDRRIKEIEETKAQLRAMGVKIDDVS
jgi:methylphosphotriester-DNA--protein-cysteine methyltransferase